MQAQTLENHLLTRLTEDAKHERRNYLGMSGIGSCPREQYWRVVDPEPPDLRLLWYSWTGYMHEAAIIKLLGAEQKERELIANFDQRYRGHTDHELPGNILIECKSVAWHKFVRFRNAKTAEKRHLHQVQAYLRHGDFKNAVIVYVARDVPHKEFYRWEWIPPFYCVDVEHDVSLQNRLDKKAMMILAAIDKGEPPRCTCSWCKR